ncbi:MAG: LacI family DNA-binding transcriptional regulator [Anaerolineae bacterium]|nr:LacI family DNA-binding transcriptional regulator [Anaerolineae bacterium]
MKKRVTIRDVAAAASVSYQTVSRVINDRPDVAIDTRLRVRRVIQELGYQPSAAARSLASRRTRTLGLITADFSDYFFTQVIVGAEAEARRMDYFFILGSTERNPSDEPEYLRLLAEREVDGILFARPSTEHDSEHVLSLIHRGVPLVTTNYYIPNEQLMVVDVDNVDGGRQAASALIEAGHREIAMIAGPPSWKSVKDRTQGCQQALAEANIPFEPSLIEHGDWSYASGQDAVERLLRGSARFTALFAQNDRMAIGAIHALRKAGRAVPEDIAIVGYDDIPVAAYCHPPLTTIHQPMAKVGQVATRLLIQIIENPDLERKEVLLKPRLVRRETCVC